MRYALPAVVAGQILLISAQVGGGPQGSLLESVVFGAFAEVQGRVTATGAAVRNAAAAVTDLRHARRENLLLRADRDTLRLRLHEQQALLERTAELERLLQLRRSVRWRTVSARIVAADATPWFRTLTIDRGSRDDVRPDQAVIAPAGVVGRIVGPTSRDAARVQLIVDRRAGAGAFIQRTGAAGVVAGGDDPALLRMSHLATERGSAAAGDRVLTSGDDGIYPRGLPIGAVAAACDAETPRSVCVAPAVDFPRLTHVLVVVPHDESVRTRLISGGAR